MLCRVDENCQIHYEVIDDVLPRDTLFIHGNIASNRWWYPAMDVLKNRKLKDNKGRAFLVEFRGCGKSTPPATLKDATMFNFCNDILQIVKNLNLEHFDLVGHSTGGLLATMIASMVPAKVSHLIALDPVGAKGVHFDPSMEQAFAAMKNDKSLTAAVIGSTILNNDPEKDFFKNTIVEDAFHAVQTVGLFVLKNLDPFDITQELKKVECKALFLHGEHDTLLPIEDTKTMASLCQKGQFAMLMGQGHCTNVENPERFAEIITDFLSH